ncbi:MAG: methyl-accepting chemotaxis protein [bacterium]
MKFIGEFQNIRHSIRLKFIVYILWGIVALSVIYSVYYVILTHSISMDEFKKRGNIIAEDFAYNIRFGVITEDKILLNELIDNIFKSKDIAYVVVTDSKDNVLVSRFKEGTMSNQLSAILSSPKEASEIIQLGSLGRYFEINKNVVTTSSTALNTQAGSTQSRVIRGYVYLGMSMKEMDKKFGHIILGAILIVLINFVLGSAITFFFTQRIVGQIPTIAEKASALSEGDLTQTVTSTSKDEIGLLADAFNAMSENLRKILNNVRETSEAIVDVVHKITSNTASLLESSEMQQKLVEETASSMNELNTSVKDIAKNTETLHSSSTESASSVLELSSSIEEVLENVEMLSSAIEETTSSIEEMSASIKQVASNVDQLLKITDETATSIVEMDASTKQIEANTNETFTIANKVMADAKEGVSAVNTTIEGMKQIKEASNHVAETIGSFIQKVEDIGKILNVIEEVTAQTNLLALNAAIIASQSGEYGKSFAVVADEIKELAERTAASTKEITNIIRAVQSESVQARESVTSVNKAVEKGSELANIAGQVLSKISESSSQASLMSGEIARATQDQAKASKEVTNAITNIATMMVEIAKATQEQARGSEQITKAAERMRSVSEQVKNSMEEQSKSSKFISQAIENISEMVNFINKATQEQAKTNEFIMSSLSKIKASSGENVSSVSQLNEIAKMLEKQSHILQDILKMFKV